jgi:queuine tRNA-ribosyltransferase
MLTDSGGFQVASLSDKARIEEEGVTFSSPLDGSRRQLTPEKAVEIQRALGSDIAMVLDECVPPGDAERARDAMLRTLRWAERSVATARAPHQWLFGIVQGGDSPELRRESARATAALGFDGFAHGGLGLGEPAEQRVELVALAQEELPEAPPRYLMGLGRPRDLVDGISAGVDLFDCVLPTRHARHGVLFTSRGLLRLKNARFAADPEPPDPDCDCPTCRGFSRAYLRHLLRAGEALGARLASVHNLRFYLALMERARAAIAKGSFQRLRTQVAELDAQDVP